MSNASGLYYLGIVAMEDIRKGIFEPSYVLCQSNGKSENRSGLRVAKADSNMILNMKKLLIGDINNHPELIEFLSNYRTRDHMHGDKKFRHKRTLKYTPEGGLFWFPCTIRGRRAEEQKPIFVKLVPDSAGRSPDDGFARLKEAMARKRTVPELFSQEPYGWLYPISTHKPTFEQNEINKEKKHGNGKSESLQHPE